MQSRFAKLAARIFKAPARVLEQTIEKGEAGEQALVNKRPFRVAEEYLNTFGPGLTTGAADDDPSGIATYSQAGAQFGFGMLWAALFTFPFMAVIQEMCARIGLVTGQGLATNIKKHYAQNVLVAVTLLLFFANTLNIAADLGAMAASVRLLIPGVSALAAVVAFALVSLLLQIFTTYARYARILKYLTLALFSYVFTAFAVHLHWGTVLYHAVVPQLSFSRGELLLLCAILGTTFSPYLFFWQPSQEVEEEIVRGDTTVRERRKNATDEVLGKMRGDTWLGMFFSNAIMFFIIAACASTLHAHGITTIGTADQAALAIRPFGGTLTYFFFAVGIIGTGLLAVPVLAGSTAYAISETFGWKQGLYRKLKEANAFYGVIIVSMIIGIAANIVHFNPIKGLLYAAIINGIIAPIVLFFVVRISSNAAVMGRHKNRPFTMLCGWLITLCMAGVAIAAIIFLFIR